MYLSLIAVAAGYMKKWCLLLLLFTCTMVQGKTSKQSIFYPQPDTKLDPRATYLIGLLKIIASYSPEKVELKPAPISPKDDDNLLLLKRGVIDVGWGAADIPTEARFNPIPYPIYKGLLGYRIMLINNRNSLLLKNVTSLQQLKQFSIGQSENWVEAELFRNNGFEVVSPTNYQALFSMLANGRYQLFPRSVTEIWEELEAFKNYQLLADQFVLLHYPHAMFFYTRKNDNDAAQYLRFGFQKAIEDGTFDAFFDKYHKQHLERANLHQRNLIKMSNENFVSLSEEQKSLYYELK